MKELLLHIHTFITFVKKFPIRMRYLAYVIPPPPFLSNPFVDEDVYGNHFVLQHGLS
jgi:hypothetical protein